MAARDLDPLYPDSICPNETVLGRTSLVKHTADKTCTFNLSHIVDININERPPAIIKS